MRTLTTLLATLAWLLPSLAATGQNPASAPAAAELVLEALEAR